MAIALFTVLYDKPPDRIEYWRRGAEGEQHTGKVLGRLEASAWRSWHDLRKANGTNIDHVVAGPSGVYLLDTKNFTGKLTVDERGLRASWHEDPDVVRCDRLELSARGAAWELHERLLLHAGVNVFVQPVIVLWGDFAQRAYHASGVWFVHGDALLSWLQSQPARRCDVGAVASLLDPLGQQPLPRVELHPQATASPTRH